MKKSHLSPINSVLTVKRSAAIALAAATMLTVTVPQAPAGITPTQLVKLLASDGTTSQRFGYSIAVDGNTALVGAPFESLGHNGAATGLAYVYTRDAQGAWTQQGQLVASDATPGDQFGFSISIKGNTALVGSINNDNVNGTNAGAAYVFTRNAQGAWTQQAKLLAADGVAFDNFGSSVSISNQLAVIGAMSSAADGMGSGAAYVFANAFNNSWIQKTKLLPTDGAPSMAFGSSVSVSGNMAIIGAPHGVNNNATSNGSENFDNSGSRSRSIAENAGSTRSISNSRIRGHINNIISSSNDSFGSVRTSTHTASSTTNSFGGRRSRNHNNSNINNQSNDGGGDNADGGDNGDGGDNNGDGGNDNGDGGDNNGDGGNDNGDGGDNNGDADNDGDTGSGDADNDGDNGNGDNGDADNDGDTGSGDADNDGDGNGGDNGDADNDGDTGSGDADNDGDTGNGDNGDADNDGDTGSGDADNDGDGDTGNDNGDADNDGDGDGAPDGDGDGDGNSSDGAAYVFMMDPSGTWTQTARLAPTNGTVSDQFGASVTISGDTAAVGAPFNGDSANTTGSAYVFTRNTTGAWTQQGGKLIPADGVSLDTFGAAVAIRDNVLVVGAPFNSETASQAGAAYVFTRDLNSQWAQSSKILPNDGAAQDQFGNSVAVFGNSAFVAASKDNDNGLNSGSAYIFNVFPADVNSDGVVNGVDMGMLLSQWGTNGSADLNTDGIVNGIDMAMMLANWGMLP